VALRATVVAVPDLRGPGAVRLDPHRHPISLAIIPNE
jgi:hypothetical protein